MSFVAIAMVSSAVVGAASLSEAYNARRRAEGKQEDAIHEQERQMGEQNKLAEEQKAKAAANKDLTQKRSKQRAARAGMTGRSSTILTEPLGTAGDAPVAPSGGKTLLGE